jgi:hypothetical protein
MGGNNTTTRIEKEANNWQKYSQPYEREFTSKNYSSYNSYENPHEIVSELNTKGIDAKVEYNIFNRPVITVQKSHNSYPGR